MSSPQRNLRSSSPDRAEAAFEWLQDHSREAFWAGVAIIVLAGGVWFYRLSQQAQARNASAALDDAEAAIASQNIPLAQSDLEKMTRRYAGTTAGKVGLVLLAQVHYQKGEYQQGVDALKPLTSANDRYFTPGALSLAAAGMEQMKNYPQAAALFQQASEKSQFESDRAVNLSAAARNLLAAGKVEEAKALYTKLAADPEGFGSAEARVRLGELTAKPAS